MTARSRVYDQTGKAVVLGPQLASGGEGAVFTLPSEGGQLAKLYHDTPDGTRVKKLRWMAAHAEQDLCRFAAWPTATLHDTPGGLLVGFLMPRFDGYRPVHMLYSPAHRRTCFPQADWAFLIHVAANCCAAFGAVHARGHVLGDVNQSNALVSHAGLVSLIDCDSFQVRDGGAVYLCEVGVGPYTPPELQGKNFHEVERTANHDRFGLAVLIFHLLFMGRHPFAGRFLGSGDMPLEKAIEEFRFVYSHRATDTKMAPPPHALPLSAVGGRLAELFERAFGEGSEKDGARPTAEEWHAGLAALGASLRPCPQAPGHKVPAHLADCPWCTITANGGPNFFLGVGGPRSTFKPDRAALEQVLQRAKAVKKKKLTAPRPTPPEPGATRPAWPGLQVAAENLVRKYALEALGLLFLLVLVVRCVYFVSLPEFQEDTNFMMWGMGWAAWVVSLLFYNLFLTLAWSIGLVGVYNAIPSRHEWEKKRREEAFKAAAERLKAKAEEFASVARRYDAEYRRLSGQLAACKGGPDELEEEYKKERQAQARKQPRRQAGQGKNQEVDAQALEEHLRRHFLNARETKIPGIGPGRLTLLASYGVETAWDVTEEALEPIRGIGQKLRQNLLAWREAVEAGFRPEEGEAEEAGPPSPEAQALVMRYMQREEALRSQLLRCAIDLESLDRHTDEELRRVEQNINEAFLAAHQAEIDMEAMA